MTMAVGLVASPSSELWISVEVTAAQALELASVIDSDDFVLVRSTGAADEAGDAPQPTPTSSPAAAPGARAGGRRRR